MEINKNSWQYRLRLAMNERGVKQADLMRATGVKSSSVSDWLNLPNRKIDAEHPLKLCNYLNITTDWLFFNKGSMIEKVKLPPLNQDKLNYNNEINNADQYKIPQFNAHGAMGNGIELIEQSGIIKEWIVSDDWLPKNAKAFTNIRNVCIITGFGDSMKGLFNCGDPLLLDTGIKSIDYDGVYFFRIGNEGFIKRLQRIPGKGLRVISENKNYETWEISNNADFEVFGKIIKAWNGTDI